MHSFLSNKKDIFKYKKFFVEGLHEVNITFTLSSNKILGFIDTLKTPQEIKKYVGKSISIKKNNLPKLIKDQYYFNDFIGLEVFVSGVLFGKVADVKNHGAGDYLEIFKGKNEILIPINNDHILNIDIERKIILNPKYYEI